MPKEVVESNKTDRKIGATLITYKAHTREIKIFKKDNQLREVEEVNEGKELTPIHAKTDDVDTLGNGQDGQVSRLGSDTEVLEGFFGK